MEIIKNKMFNTFILSMLPISELRGSIIYAGANNLNLFESTIISIIGNIIIIPILLMILLPITDILKKTKLKKFIESYENKAIVKLQKYDKYAFWALAIFVGIPAPTTGVYSASIAAMLLGIKFKKALFSMSIGVCMSGTIMFIFVYLTKIGIVNFFSF